MKLLLFTCLLLTGCGATNTKPEKQYDYEDVTRHIDWYDSFDQEENEYLVYYYSDTCSHCSRIKNDIIEYYFSNIETLYFVNTNQNSVFGKTKDLTGLSDIESFYIFGTPFLIRFKDWKISDYYPGSNSVLTYINSKK